MSRGDVIKCVYGISGNRVQDDCDVCLERVEIF